ncbi:hypothetical protein HYV49_00525 [Candidatus Pacearchaeota archaeon]|nr:hypothetical protein [Candidatus Pacearchaeota archaeon]
MDKVHTIVTLEILGRPKEYVEQTIKELIDSIEKEVEVKDKKFFDAKQVEDKNLYTTFTEIEVHFKEISHLIQFVLRYLPSHIEIIEPEHIKLTNSDVNTLVGELTIMMHRYDEVTKGLLYERNALLDLLKKHNIKSPFPERDLGEVVSEKDLEKS